MPKQGSGRNKTGEVLLEIQAGHSDLLARIDEILECASVDTVKDLGDDNLYGAALKRVEIMQDLPDCQLRGHLNLLAKELSSAIAADLSHTAGDSVRKAVQPLRDSVNEISNRAHELMGEIGGKSDAT